ncbi:UDP binding domain-containing protein [Streptomyces sp. NBC_00272]|uniref:UDP binding domain-containing protein n=1 Tax=Streptomyces sp. NBC_00272 TaxID=2975698 RepID=UPI002E2C8FF2|nr:UDP binding domain-containing protein [Streptomyces sp. NBC_00272]
MTVWGTPFKPETDEIRDSPALAVAQALHGLGATVTVTDPKAHPQFDYVEDPAAAQDIDLPSTSHRVGALLPGRPQTRATPTLCVILVGVACRACVRTEFGLFEGPWSSSGRKTWMLTHSVAGAGRSRGSPGTRGTPQDDPS